jgi:aldose 1-epimerase
MSTRKPAMPCAADFNAVHPLMNTHLFFLTDNNIQVAITNYGARIVSLLVPDLQGRPTDVVLGFDSLAGYLSATVPYYGAIIGRYANRIANGQFLLGGHTYHLTKNNGNNTLHGGHRGLHHKVWDVQHASSDVLELSCKAAHLEEGFPGCMNILVTFGLAGKRLSISYRAVTDRTTVINLTNHTYFNLNGAGNGTISDHSFQINANHFTPVNTQLIPYGNLLEVADTIFDLRIPASIRSRLKADNEQLNYCGGFDHNFVLNRNTKQEITEAATITGDQTGIRLSVFTTEPGLQFYTGNFMDGTNLMKAGKADIFRTGFCLETQHFPDSPNQPSFPPVILEPGNVFTSQTTWDFRS